MTDGSSEKQTARELVASASRIVGFTGAGISTESGVPDFRSPEGVWARNRTVYFQEFLSSEADRIEYWRQKMESPDIKVGRSQRTGTTCAVSPAHLSSSNNYRLNTLRRLLAAAEQAPQPERGLRRRPSTEARKYCSGRSQKNP